jgi:hypothetical protein
MARHVEDDDEWDEDEDWEDDVDEPPGDVDDSTIPCPYCERPVHEDSVRCPHCERFISEEDVQPTRKPWWIIVGALLALYVVYRWIVG